MLTSVPKGTKDIMTDQIYKWHYAENKFREICERYGFKEIRTPIFEHTELFQRGIGDTTDVVQKEMYTFLDHGDRSITLKPEGTSPAVRAFIEHKQFAEVQPTKYCYITPCFRYEKPQAGRLRQFHQFGIETFGASDMIADAEIISLANDFLKGLGIKDITLRINSVGCPECRSRHRTALKEFLKPKYDELCDTCKDRYERNPMRIIDCKSPVCQSLIKGAPMMVDYLCDDCRNAFEQLKENLTAMGIEYEIDPTIVRGLDYYTKTAFEFVTGSLGAQSTVCGGGRYDHLVEEIGGPSVPGVGFGLGIERLLMLMEANEAFMGEDTKTDVFIAFMGNAAKLYALKLARELRAAGLNVQTDPLARNLKGQFKYADRLAAEYTIVVGDNELEAGAVNIKTMAKSSQETVPFDKILEYVSR